MRRDFSWTLSDALSDGSLAYARYGFAYTAKLAGSEGKRVFFSGISQVRLQDGLIAHYGEVFDRGIALVANEFCTGADGEVARALGGTGKERAKINPPGCRAICIIRPASFNPSLFFALAVLF